MDNLDTNTQEVGNYEGVESKNQPLEKTSEQTKPVRRRKPVVYLIILAVILSIVASVFFAYKNYFSKDEPLELSGYASGEVYTPTSLKEKFEGSIEYIGEDSSGANAMFELAATSSEGDIKEMNIWTDKKIEDNWQDYKTSVEVPLGDIDEYVYVIYKDNTGNVSDIYFSSIKE